MFTLYLGLQGQYDDRAKCQGCVSCKSCTKPRCIYTDRNLHNREQRELKEIIRSYDYVCECLMTPDISFLSSIVFTRLEMHCKTPVEWAYYSSIKITTRKNLHCHCTKSGAKVDKEEKKLYKTVLPLCEQRKAQGKKILKRGPIQTAKANKERARAKNQ